MNMSKQRRTLTLQEKIAVIHAAEKSKQSIREIAKEFSVGKTQVACILKARCDLLLQYHSTTVNVNRKRNYLKKDGRKIDDVIFNWFIAARSNNIPISGSLIQEKAKEVARSLGIDNFKASNGWLSKFQKRHNISCKNISEKEAALEPADVTTFLEVIIKDEASSIYNANETDSF